eukprot:749138-Hanusia_phi.AAC.1
MLFLVDQSWKAFQGGVAEFAVIGILGEVVEVSCSWAHTSWQWAMDALTSMDMGNPLQSVKTGASAAIKVMQCSRFAGRAIMTMVRGSSGAGRGLTIVTLYAELCVRGNQSRFYADILLIPKTLGGEFPSLPTSGGQACWCWQRLMGVADRGGQGVS